MILLLLYDICQSYKYNFLSDIFGYQKNTMISIDSRTEFAVY